MILRIKTIAVSVLLAIPCAFFLLPTAKVRSAPKVQAPKVQAPNARMRPQKQFPWRGLALPISLASTADEFEGEPRNENWQDYAQMLRVRDLRVYEWSESDNYVGLAEQQQRKVENWLRASGYAVKKTQWGDANTWQSSKGFEAHRKDETISALWHINGSNLALYWGHQAPATSAQKLNDELAKAISDGTPEKVKTLLKAGADPRATDYVGGSMLMRAIYSDNAGSLRLLLKAQGETRNQAPEFGEALDVAAENDNAAAVAVFLKMGANSVQIGQALRAAAGEQRSADKAARLLVFKAPMADVEATLITASYVDEFRGAAIQHPEIVNLMLTRKPSQTTLNQGLLAAAYDDQNLIVPMLLKAGAAPNATDEKGETALVRASNRVDLTTVETLLKAGADPNTRAKDGTTALLSVVGLYSYYVPNVVKALLGAGANPSITDVAGKTALENAKINLADASETDLLQRQQTVQLLEAATQTKSQGK